MREDARVCVYAEQKGDEGDELGEDAGCDKGQWVEVGEADVNYERDRGEGGEEGGQDDGHD